MWDFVLLFTLWDYVLWYFVLCDYVRVDFVPWDFVLWDIFLDSGTVTAVFLTTFPYDRKLIKHNRK